MDIEKIAAVCHDANRTYCEQLGDHSQQSWPFAPEWQKQSARDGVEFHIANPEAGPELSHAKWMQDKTEQGWVYGPEKNEREKIHPALVPFRELSPEVQRKDKLFAAIVGALKP